MLIPKPFISGLLLHKPFIYKNIISTVIAPHGITDLIHSYQQNKTKELLLINTSITTTSYLLSLHHNLCYLVDISFMVSSIIHFRHDMPLVFMFPKYLFCILLLLFSIYGSHDLFYLYMCLIHVPKHYQINMKFIKKNIIINLLIIMITTLFFTILPFIIVDDFINYPILLSISKGIIISHILYEELYIHHS